MKNIIQRKINKRNSIPQQQYQVKGFYIRTLCCYVPKKFHISPKKFHSKSHKVS